MGTCLVEGCNGFAISGDICALCANTQPLKKLTKATSVSREKIASAEKAAAAKRDPDASVELVCANGATKPHEKFLAACEDYSDRFFALLAKGHVGGTAEKIHNCMVYHDTQPRANRTVFYDWQGKSLRIFGVGSHSGGSGAGNDSYTFIWFDGKSKDYTR